jgi:DivIVA domain-containing protein
VRHRYFPRTSRFRRGYHCRQVESFLTRLDVSMNGQLPPMSPSDIRRVGFELVRHGYDVAAVDSHLDGLEERVLALQSGGTGRRGRTDIGQDAAYLRGQLEAAYMQRFSRVRWWRRGYDFDEVDDFIDRVSDVLAGVGQLSVEETRTVAFRPKRGGYREDAVDETLDRVVEILLVQRRAEDTSVQKLDPAT